MEGDHFMSYFKWDGSGATTGAGTVFTEVTGNLQFTDDDIRAVYIDWDDGTSNKKTESNYQWVQLSEPTGTLNVTHTYTATGTFKPVVQTVNSRGFFSKYYSSEASNSDISPFAQSTSMQNTVIADTAATGIIKMENRTVKSGVDNSIFDAEGPKDLFIAVAPSLTQNELKYFCETGSSTTGSINVDVKCILNYGIRDGDGATIQTDTGGERIIKTLPVVLSGTNLTGSVTGLRNILASGAHNLSALESGAQVSQVLEVKFKNPKYAGSDTTAYNKNEVYNRLKIFLLAYSNNLGKYVPVSYVTAGEPIKKSVDVLRNVSLDFSQSRAAASNVAISSYRYDLGKGWFQSAYSWGTGSTTTFSDATKQTGDTKDTAYTYMVRPDGLTGAAGKTLFTTSLPWNTNNADSYLEDQLLLDDYGRFVPQYHLTRMSVEPASSAANVSTITDNKPEVFRITPAISWAVTSNGSTAASAANAKLYPTKVIDSGTNASKSKQYTTESFNNTSGSSGLVSLAGVNDMTFYDVTNTERANAGEYLLCMFDKKTNKIFLDLSNHADNLISDPNVSPAYGIAGIYYLAVTDKGTPTQNAYWQPVEFDDGTAITREFRDETNDTYDTVKYSLSKSGYLSFDMPLDWGNLSITGAMGGAYNSTTIPSAATSMDYAGAGSPAGLATGTVGTAADGTVIGDYIPYTMTANPISALASNSDIGSFKYMFIRVDDGTPTVSGAYWISKDGDSGYDSANDKIYLHLGDKSSTTGAGITKGYIRRVNVYDIIDGFSKVYMPVGGSATQLFGVGDDGNWSTPWNNTYSINTSNTIGPQIASAWSSEKYLLKIVLSGATTATNNLYPEIWNVFDATRGYTSVIKSVDNSAYSLNSLSITSDVSVTRAGNYFQAITRKGKVFIARVGTPIQTISFDSVALGDSSSSTAFEDYGDPSTLYGHLHMVRKLQADNVRVYWDEIQKDGTYVRFWGMVTNVSESLATGGPRAIQSYNFNMIVEEIALLDNNHTLITDVFPLGSVEYARDYS